MVSGCGDGEEFIAISVLAENTVWSLVSLRLGDKVVWIQTGTCQSLGCLVGAVKEGGEMGVSET